MATPRVVPARLPPSPSPEPRAATPVNQQLPPLARKKTQNVTGKRSDDNVAKKMEEAAEKRIAAAEMAEDQFSLQLEPLKDAQPFLNELVITESLRFALQSAAPESSAALANSSDFVLVPTAVSAPVSQNTPAAQPTPLPVLSAAPKQGTPKATVAAARPVSNSGMTHAQLCVEVRAVNKNLKPHFQLKNVKQASVGEIDIFLQKQRDIVACATIHAQCEGAKTRLTQAIQVTVCMRMLTLLAKKPELLALYQDSCGGTDRQQNDAGANPHVNTGMGMGLNHAYFPAMELAFNDPTFVDEFPFEYFAPTESDLLATHSNGVNSVPVPPKIVNGLFAGIGIKECLIPENFPATFFDVERLSTMFAAGLNEYHNALAKFSVSGQHGKPLWFFVAPRKTIIPEDQFLYLDSVAKRWDTLAFHLMFQQVQELTKIFAKEVPNGKGGVESPVELATPPVGASARTVATRDRENAEKRAGAADQRSQQVLDMKIERHAQHMASCNSKQQLSHNHLETLTAIKSFIDMKSTFADLSDQGDMVKYCDAQITALKDSLTSTTTTSSSMFNSPGPLTPSGSTPPVPMSPIHPIPSLGSQK